MPTIEEFFNTAKQELALDPHMTYRSADSFGDSPELADTIADLIVSGKKTATSSGFELYMHDHEPMPEVGDVNVVLNGRQEPVAVTYLEDTFIKPFASVDATQAQLEGEGDLSLTYWQREHARFFKTAYAKAGLTFDPETSMVVIERFRVLYPFVD
ncbi:ASCH domain-containing protein [Lacticaseibacillus porcinae]|uniref:ASCH domain-containing protein n=1 Tax=Lacticaseibacillus porcinae TaxID=1123687 RepID=UPI000F781B9D|nr:ASCH domain-containing protein [Lacticaseibacillus porcinae]